MDTDRHIPWVPRAILRKLVEPAKQLCERTLDVLYPVMLEALRPFPEARQALALALQALIQPEPAL